MTNWIIVGVFAILYALFGTLAVVVNRKRYAAKVRYLEKWGCKAVDNFNRNAIITIRNNFVCWIIVIIWLLIWPVSLTIIEVKQAKAFNKEKRDFTLLDTLEKRFSF